MLKFFTAKSVALSLLIQMFGMSLPDLNCIQQSENKDEAKIRIGFLSSVMAANESSSMSGKKKDPVFVGTWQGSIDVGNGMKMPLVFHIKNDGSAYSGTMDSPSQGAQGIKFDTVNVDAAGKIHAEIEKLKAHYDGKISESKSEISGTWSQSTSQFPLNLKSTSGYLGPKRPQEPKAPFSYKSESVNFKSAGADIAGTLTLPQGKGPFPAIILIHGSGPHDRDETIFFHKPFLLLSDSLTRQEIAVLRYDKRGCGKSTGVYKECSTKNFADDAVQALQFLKSRQEIASDQIGLLGHSEGGVVAPMVAEASNDVRFIVSLAGSALPGDEILISQIKALSSAQNAKQEELSSSLEIAKETYAIIKSEPNDQIAIEKIKSMRKRLHAAEYESSSAQKQSASAIDGSLKLMTSPWYRFFLSYDPRQSWSKVKCPVLALNGAVDTQVIADDNLKAIRTELEKSGNKNLTEVKFPGLNHLFQTCKTGHPAEYASIEETISPAVLKTISDWIQEILKKS